MPKRYGDLYTKIIDIKNLYKAYMLARRGKRYKNEVIRYKLDLYENLSILYKELKTLTYKTGEYKKFYIYEPKQRLIEALPFKDRVCQHALYNVIEPIFNRIFIYDSYACRKGKGMHSGAKRVQYFMRLAKRNWNDVWILKADVRKYFDSVDHKILYEIIQKKIKCKDTLWLIKQIIDSKDNSENKGIPVGNLTSQLFANIYLNELDQYIKRELKIKYYVRYMDDFIVFCDSKEKLKEILHKIKVFLKEKLKLELNSKTNIFPLNQGVNYLGYRIFPTHMLLREKSKKKMKRKMKAFQKKYKEGKITLEQITRCVVSWKGHAKHAATYNLQNKIFEKYYFTKT